MSGELPTLAGLFGFAVFLLGFLVVAMTISKFLHNPRRPPL